MWYGASAGRHNAQSRLCRRVRTADSGRFCTNQTRPVINQVAAALISRSEEEKGMSERSFAFRSGGGLGAVVRRGRKRDASAEIGETQRTADRVQHTNTSQAFGDHVPPFPIRQARKTFDTGAVPVPPGHTWSASPAFGSSRTFPSDPRAPSSRTALQISRSDCAESERPRCFRTLAPHRLLLRLDSSICCTPIQEPAGRLNIPGNRCCVFARPTSNPRLNTIRV